MYPIQGKCNNKKKKERHNDDKKDVILQSVFKSACFVNTRIAIWPHSVHLYGFIFRGNINDDYSAFRLCCITPDFITTNSNQFPQPERKTTLSLTHTVHRPPVTGLGSERCTAVVTALINPIYSACLRSNGYPKNN